MQNPSMSVTRRNALRASVAAGAAALAAGSRSQASRAAQPAREEREELEPGSVILFQGDSITDAGRDRNAGAANDPRGLGDGYPFLLASELLRDHADPEMKVFNRGISGNKVPDLQARWKPDALELRPDVLSILIGVNDIWHKLNGRYDGTVEDYESGYRELLQGTRSALPNTRIIVCEPFVLRCGAVTDAWFPEFDERRAAAKRVAGAMELTFVPFQSMFDEATRVAPPEYWAADGVHPTLAGHARMAKTWRDVTGL